MKKILISAVLALSLVIVSTTSNVFATSSPTFFSCTNPTQNANINFSGGTHGIPGDSSSHTGTDSVFLVGPGNAVQCLCESSGQGTQTNWWKIDNMSQNEISNHIKEGWIYIPDGSAWGLDNAPYLASNSFFICGALGRGGGEILGTGGGEVLGLASTGGENFMFLSLFSGLCIISLGLYLFDEKRAC